MRPPEYGPYYRRSSLHTHVLSCEIRLNGAVQRCRILLLERARAAFGAVVLYRPFKSPAPVDFRPTGKAPQQPARSYIIPPVAGLLLPAFSAGLATLTCFAADLLAPVSN